MIKQTLRLAALLSFAIVAAAQSPKHVTSRDGTRIAYDESGKGPALIVVGGALADRRGGSELAQLLAPHLTVYSYDRRGRGDSTDTKPYSVKREIEDLAALIEAAGGSAFVYGKSSGAALALQAASELGAEKVRKLAIYEPPYNEAAGAAQEWRAFRRQLDQLLAADRRDDAVTQFLRFVGAPDAAVAKLKSSPAWPGMLAMAPTLAYDNAVLGEDRSVPGSVARIRSPTLVMDGGASAQPMPFMRVTADELGKTIPNAQRLTVDGQGHDVSSKVLAPLLLKFFTAPGDTPAAR